MVATARRPRTGGGLLTPVRLWRLVSRFPRRVSARTVGGTRQNPGARWPDATSALPSSWPGDVDLDHRARMAQLEYDFDRARDLYAMSQRLKEGLFRRRR